MIVCPTNVEPDDPRSYYSVAEKLSKDALSNHLQLGFEITGKSARRIDIFAYGHPAVNLLKALEIQFQANI